MADIMMCDAVGCPNSVFCRRHQESGTRPDTYRQAYWARDEASPVGEACRNFWPIRQLCEPGALEAFTNAALSPTPDRAGGEK